MAEFPGNVADLLYRSIPDPLGSALHPIPDRQLDMDPDKCDPQCCELFQQNSFLMADPNVLLQAMFVFLHLLKGTPWEPGDQGVTRTLTHWEQIDDGAQFTATRKFLTIFPIIM
jgi:hypothetical protein